MLVLMWEDDVVLLPRDESLQFCTNLVSPLSCKCACLFFFFFFEVT